MSKKKKKFYVVWEGHETGVTDSWETCKEYTNGYNKPKFKSFNTLEEAEVAFLENPFKHIKNNQTKRAIFKKQNNFFGKPNLDTVSVDAACSGNPGIVEYQCVDTKTKELIFHFGLLYHSTNNVGEFLGLVHTLAHMKKTNDKRPIYSDSRIAISWVWAGKHRSKLKPNELNSKSFELLERANKWLENNKIENEILKWVTKAWGEIPADFGRK